MQHIAIYSVCLLLTGCAANAVVPSKLERPASRLMAAPVSLPDIKAGDDLYEANAVCRGEYGRETGKLKGLQTYINTVIKK